MRKKAKNGKTLNLELKRLSDKLAGALVRDDKADVRNARHRLDAFKNGLSTIERERFVSYAHAHEPAESASAILLGA
jgi:division protein CdvB (Snf7/Vps24/ESCRT-III family)